MGKVKPQPKTFGAEKFQNKKATDKGKIQKAYKGNKENAKLKNAFELAKVGNIMPQKAKSTVGSPKVREPLVKLQTKVLPKSMEKPTKAPKPKTSGPKDILVSEEQAAKGVNAVIQLMKKSGNKNELFEDEKEFFVQVRVVKVPKMPSRMVHLPLSYPVLGEEPEVCLIVAEVKGIDKNDHEKTVEYYEEFLRNKNVHSITKILPIDQLLKEYDQFELKIKLSNLYDIFLVDGKISGKVCSRLGKIFFKKRKTPTCVNLGCADVKKNIEFAMKKVGMHLHPNGDNYSVKVANTKMPEKHIVKNVLAIIQCFKTQLPGGWENIRSLYIKSTNTTAVPLYYSLKNKAEVNVPVVIPKKPKAFELTEGEITTKPGLEVMVLPTGKIVEKRKHGDSALQQTKAKKQKKEEKPKPKKEEPEAGDSDEDFNEEEQKDFAALKKELGIADETLEEEFSENEESMNDETFDSGEEMEDGSDLEFEDNDNENENEEFDEADEDVDEEELKKYIQQQVSAYKKAGHSTENAPNKKKNKNKKKKNKNAEEKLTLKTEEEPIQPQKALDKVRKVKAVKKDKINLKIKLYRQDQQENDKQADTGLPEKKNKLKNPVADVIINKQKNVQQNVSIMTASKKQKKAKQAENVSDKPKQKKNKQMSANSTENIAELQVKSDKSIVKKSKKTKSLESTGSVPPNKKQKKAAETSPLELAPKPTKKGKGVDKKSNNTSFLEETFVEDVSAKKKKQSNKNKATVQPPKAKKTASVDTDMLFDKLSEKKLKKKSKKAQ